MVAATAAVLMDDDQDDHPGNMNVASDNAADNDKTEKAGRLAASSWPRILLQGYAHIREDPNKPSKAFSTRPIPEDLSVEPSIPSFCGT